ncbi:lipase [Saccharothrix sp. S26]|uniref:alpha/beta hydrolase family protein n=1 Tax=Saccharothrix sp. S26 TaxID=2907215 RepID=UPI001F45CDA8|nr:lipase [Saccharothrix sp. S26]MCE6996065.1 lipase [Saccharothrix sp. S26]
MTAKRLLVPLLAGAALTAAVPVATAAPSAVRLEVPAPTGPFRVGTTDLHLVDHARPDPWVPGATRELMVTVRYPATRTAGDAAPFMPPAVAAAVAASDARALRIDPAELDYGFATHSVPDAPAVPGHRPVVLYSPGRGNPRALGTGLTEQLASQGYVVVAIDHTHEPLAVQFPDGRVAPRSIPPLTVDVTKKMMATRVRDARFVLDQLEVLARGGNPDAARRPLPAGLGRSLDLSRVGAFGHSAGGFTTGEAMLADPRIDAGANLDGSMAHSQSTGEFGRVAEEGLDRPFLLMSAGDHSAASDLSWQRFLANHRAWVRQLHLPDAEHSSFTDHQSLVPLLAAHLGLDQAVTAPIVGTVDPARSTAAQRAYLTAFFDQHLRHRPRHLLDGPSDRYPEVRFLG